jgi:hypothetical protein
MGKEQNDDPDSYQECDAKLIREQKDDNKKSLFDHIILVQTTKTKIS